MTNPLSAQELGNLTDDIGSLIRRTLKKEIAGARAVSQAVQGVASKVSDIAGDLVTQTDYAIQAQLEPALLTLVPNSHFVGEENFNPASALTDGPLWVVDPLDGTVNYACDLPFYGASVALLVNRRPVLGVVYEYGTDTLYDAVRGHGARHNGAKLRWDNNLAARAPVGISSGFLAMMQTTPSQFAREWLGSRYRIFGSQAVQLAWAAAGRLRLNINFEAKLWDDAAGALICQEAGASYAALEADPIFPLMSDGAALGGRNLFSVSGHPDLVIQARRDFIIEGT